MSYYKNAHMISSPPRSCPICENNSLVSSNHKCQDYYDEMTKMTISTQTTGPVQYIPISSGFTYQPKTLTGKIDMLSELQLMKTQEPCVLIPLTLIMDLYAMAIIADNKQVIEGLKKAIKGEK